MIYRTSGRMGWSVSEIDYEMWGLAGWTGSDETESQTTLEQAVALGCNFFDTAWAYGSGRSEQILGGLLKNHPGKTLHFATKIPPKNLQWPSRRGSTLDDCFPPDHIRICLQAQVTEIKWFTMNLREQPPGTPEVPRSYDGLLRSFAKEASPFPLS